MSTETHSQIANFIWSICNLLRGPYRRNEYRKVILPLTVLRRFDCILAPTKAAVLKEHAAIKAKPENIIRHKLSTITKHSLYNLSKFTIAKPPEGSGLNGLLDDPNQLAPNLNSYINAFSPNVRAIMERFKFGDEIATMTEKDLLYLVIKRFAAIDLSPVAVDNVQMGYVFEELIRIGAEQSNEEAGEHFTPREVIKLMVNLLLSPEKDLARTLGFSGRFGAGTPRVNDGALLFLQHMLAKMRAPQDGGSRLAIVFNGSPLFTGDAGGGESDIRRWIIENDWLEAIVALPEQLFYNTGISTYLWVLTNRKEKSRKQKVQLIDARPFWVQMETSLGNKRRRIGDPSDKERDPDHIGELTKIFGNFRDGQTRTFTEEDAITHQPVQRQRVVSKIFDNEDFGYHKITVERPLRLNFQASAQRIARLDDESGFKNLASSARKDPIVRQQQIEAGQQRQEQIRELLRAFGKATKDKLFKDRKAFLTELRKLDRERDVRLSAPELKAVLAALGERDEASEICRDRDDQPEPDADLRDTETVPLKASIEEYFKREVLPHVKDAWIDTTKTKVGYEIPLNRHFYRYEPPRPLEVIETDIKKLEGEILTMLREVTA